MKNNINTLIIMKRYINIFAIGALAAAATGCSDFLELEPKSSGTEAIFFQNAEQFEQAANACYDFTGWKSSYWWMDGGTDLSGFTSTGGGTTVETDEDNWNYENIRTCCILLSKAEQYANPDEISASVGTAYFFRAWDHFRMLQKYGGIPIVDHVLDVNDEVIYGLRNSRYEVINFIISDLQKAIELLPKESAIASADKGKVSKEGAQGFLARVCLYEGTWEKYVPSIGYDLDGDGQSQGAGSAKPDGYPSVTELLTLARDNAKAVINEAETGTFQLWNECDSLSYYYLFNLDDGEGNLANYMGAGKSSNKEFILKKPYDYTLQRGGINIGHVVATWQGFNFSSIFADQFVCRNGLPIRVSYTGSMNDVQDNPEFGGWETYMGEYYNRDYRFIGSTCPPDRVSWGCRPEYLVALTELGNPYPEAYTPAATDYYDASDPIHTTYPHQVLYNPVIGQNSTHNSYWGRKYLIEGEGRSTTYTESADFPIMRLAEIHCIYAEAVCELGNGTISDGDLDFSINKNRARAGVAPLTNSLISNVWDCTYFNHETGRTECHKMTMLDEIRRERACELFAEGFRMNDLKRWGIAHINLKGQKLGRRILGTAYTTHYVNQMEFSGTPCYDPDTRPLLYGIFTENTSDPDYGRAIANLAANTFYTQKDYLDPLPLDQIRLNPQLKQNPGW